MTAKECVDEQEQGQSRVEISEGDGEPEGQRGVKGDDQMARVPASKSAERTASRQRDDQSEGRAASVPRSECEDKPECCSARATTSAATRVGG